MLKLRLSEWLEWRRGLFLVAALAKRPLRRAIIKLPASASGRPASSAEMQALMLLALALADLIWPI